MPPRLDSPTLFAIMPFNGRGIGWERNRMLANGQSSNRDFLRPVPIAIFCIALLVSTGCTTTFASPVSPVTKPQARQLATKSPITHVIIVIQENRTFDNLFATFPGADGTRYGKTLKSSAAPDGRVKLSEGPLIGHDIGHGHAMWLKAYDKGKMDGFGLNDYPTVPPMPAGYYPYEFVRPSEIVPYWDLARKYVLADHMFQTQSSDSFTAHQDLIAGATAINQNQSIIDSPTHEPYGCDAPKRTKTSLITSTNQYLLNQGPFPCFSYPTLRDRLDAAHLSWRFYTPALDATGDYAGGEFWNAFDAIRAVRYDKHEWATNVSSPQTRIFSDITSHDLAAVSWVIPDLLDSDHPGDATDQGPSWVAQIVNTVGESEYWKSTAIVIVWDDWGGWYDHISPPQLDYQGLGFRVPCLIVSPYSGSIHIDHTQYEFGSILKFIEENWGLESLHVTDARATSIGNSFDFTNPPSTFIKIPAKYSKAFFEHEAPSYKPIDTE